MEREQCEYAGLLCIGSLEGALLVGCQFVIFISLLYES